MSSSGDLTTIFYFQIDSDPKKSASHKFFEPNQANGSKKKLRDLQLIVGYRCSKRSENNLTNRDGKCFELSIHLPKPPFFL